MKTQLTQPGIPYPCPVVLVSSAYAGQEALFTVSWTGIVCSQPEYLAISILPGNFSYNIITAARSFCVNIPDQTLIQEADYCGISSSAEEDKFAACGFHKLPGQTIEAPLLAECPLNLECRVKQIIPLGSHDLFIAEVINKLADSRLIQQLQQAEPGLACNPPIYFRPHYYALQPQPLGTIYQTGSSMPHGR